jgi:hypothetical protein|nr:hypothetical protein [uncultured Mediterranean phage uvMED]|tara:strand:+ start:312 stop:737 length:426 start_codon:yes stop_codon:yes gene_type:complete
MAAADLNAIRATIESRLATELANSPTLPVVFHNMAYEPAPNTSWVQCLTTFGANEYLGQGSTTNSQNRIVGLLLLNIFSPKGVGPGANYVIGKRIRDLYNRAIVSGVFFDAPTGPEALASPTPEGFFQTQVRVTFEFIEEL